MYGLVVAISPTTDPVSLAEAKAHCRVEQAEEDALLAGYIIAARQHLEQITGRALPVQSFDMTLDDFPCGSVPIALPRAPATSIVSIQYVDADGTTQTWASSNYQFDGSRDPARVVPAPNVFWPATQNRLAAVTVRFVAGYSQIPEPLRHAMLLLIGYWYANREAVNIGNIVSELPMGVQALIAPYRLWTLA